jgi:hypothetical protein
MLKILKCKITGHSYVPAGKCPFTGKEYNACTNCEKIIII